MARRAALILGLLVLALHVALLQALSPHLLSSSRLQTMAPAMFTREIVATTAPEAAKPEQKPPSRQRTSRSVATESVAKAPKPTASHPEPTTSAPEPTPTETAGALVTATATATTTATATAIPSANNSAAANNPAAGSGPLAVLGPTPGASAASSSSSAVAASVVGDGSASATAPVSAPAITPAGAPASASDPSGGTASTGTTPSAASGVAEVWPANTRLSYALKGNYRGPIGGSARVQWLRGAQGYEVSIVIDLPLLLEMRMTSQGSIGAEHLAPRAYEERMGTRVRPLRLEATQIELAGGQRLPRPPQVQDTASQFVELAQRFRTQPSLLATGKTVPVWLARPGGVDEWIYDVLGTETLHSNRLGAIEAFHLKPRPIPNARGPIHAEIWFAPTLQYLPVRIRLNIGPDAWLDLMVERIEQGG